MATHGKASSARARSSPLVAPPSRLALQRKSSGARGAADVPPVVDDVLRTPGRPLDAATRAIMEPRFGKDFSQVRVHSDAPAAQSARAIDAQAYAVGTDLVFGAGQFAPQTASGTKLLAHADLLAMFRITPQPGSDPEEVAAAVAGEPRRRTPCLHRVH